MKKSALVKMLLIGGLMLSPVLIPASKAGDPGPDCATAPLDGGLSLMLIAGVSYGVAKLKKNKEK